MVITADDANKSTSMHEKVTPTIAAATFSAAGATGLSSGAMAGEATINEQPAAGYAADDPPT